MGRLGVLKDIAALYCARCRNAVLGCPRPRRLPAWNNLHVQKNLVLLAREKSSLETFDLYLYRALNAKYLRGQIAFEYGTLLNYVQEWPGLRVLDVGAGRSSLPRWMARQGASVVAFEYPNQVEKPAVGWRGHM